MAHSTRSRPTAFTLVEVLVVIGVIGVLMGILLPAIAASRHRANTVICEAHLHEVGHAFQCYAADNRDVFPWAQLQYTATDGTACVISWDDLLSPYLGTGLTDDERRSAYAPRPQPILTCPEDQQFRIGYLIPTNGRTVYARSYGVNCWPDKPDARVDFEGVGGTVSTAEPIPWSTLSRALCVRQTWVVKPAETILAFDFPNPINSLGGCVGYAGTAFTQVAAAAAFTPTSSLGDYGTVLMRPGPHGGMWNYAFCDGHVDLLLSQQTARPSSGYLSDAGNNFMWTRDPND